MNNTQDYFEALTEAARAARQDTGIPNHPNYDPLRQGYPGALYPSCEHKDTKEMLSRVHDEGINKRYTCMNCGSVGELEEK